MLSKLFEVEQREPLQNKVVVTNRKEDIYGVGSDYAFSSFDVHISCENSAQQFLIDLVEQEKIRLTKMKRKAKDLWISRQITLDWGTFAHFCVEMKRDPLSKGNFFYLVIKISNRIEIELQSPPLHLRFKDFKPGTKKVDYGHSNF